MRHGPATRRGPRVPTRAAPPPPSPPRPGALSPRRSPVLLSGSGWWGGAGAWRAVDGLCWPRRSRFWGWRARDCCPRGCPPGGVLLPVHPAREALPSPCCRGVTVPDLFQQMDEAGGREKWQKWHAGAQPRVSAQGTAPRSVAKLLLCLEVRNWRCQAQELLSSRIWVFRGFSSANQLQPAGFWPPDAICCLLSSCAKSCAGPPAQPAPLQPSWR